MLIGAESTTIELIDMNANTVFVQVTLTPEQLSQMLSRLSHTHCEIEVMGLDKVGKTHENEQFEFEIDRNISSSTYSVILQKIAQEILDIEGGGWIADVYFSSQNSFFTFNDKNYARCTKRRYI